MKRSLLILMFMLMGISAIYAQSQEGPIEIVDSTYIWQRKSHFHTGTWEHPYHRLWYRIFYHTYEEDYNNNETQWNPLNAYGSVKVEAKKKEKTSTDTIASKKTDIFLDQMIDMAYLQEYNALNTLINYCENSINLYRYSAAPDCEYNSSILYDRYKTLTSNVHTTNVSQASSGEKREAYQEIQKDFIKLIAVTQKLIRANNLIVRHNNN